MKLRLLGIRLEVCWDEEPDSETLSEPSWVKSSGLEDKDKVYEGIVTSAKRTGLYL
jgi:hypothetical protein